MGWAAGHSYSAPLSASRVNMEGRPSKTGPKLGMLSMAEKSWAMQPVGFTHVCGVLAANTGDRGTQPWLPIARWGTHMHHHQLASRWKLLCTYLWTQALSSDEQTLN